MPADVGWQVLPGAAVADVSEVARRLDRPVSRFRMHGNDCCRFARQWFECMARAALRSKGHEPRWITERWRWGPTAWPAYWCEAVKSRELDCGGLAELAEAAFRAAGREVVRVQMILEELEEQCEHWGARWASTPAAPSWILGRFVYHEEVAVVEGSARRFRNPLAGGWRDDRAHSDGDPKAIRVHAAPSAVIDLGRDGCGSIAIAGGR